MDKNHSIRDWIPLLTKLVWPVITLFLLIVFNSEVRDIYNVVMSSMKAGRSVEIGGFLKLGEAASELEIGNLSQANISIRGIGGSAGVARKGSSSDLRKLQRELEANPNKSINTLLLPDHTIFSVNLIKQYIGTLGLKFVVFQKSGKFNGWIHASTFVAQLPESNEQNDTHINFDNLRSNTIGISMQSVRPDGSAKEVLEKMSNLHIDSIPVVDANGQWQFFASREEILANLISTIILDKNEIQE